MELGYMILADVAARMYKGRGMVIRGTTLRQEVLPIVRRNYALHPAFIDDRWEHDDVYYSSMITQALSELGRRGAAARKQKKVVKKKRSVGVVAIKVEVTESMLEQGVLFSWMIKGGN